MTLRESTILLIGITLIFIAAGIALHLWGPQSVGPCEVDAPMEQAQCRAVAGPRPEWLVRK